MYSQQCFIYFTCKKPNTLCIIFSKKITKKNTKLDKKFKTKNVTKLWKTDRKKTKSIEVDL